MRAVMRIATALILLAAFAGCGQKGALYRDHQNASVPAPAEADSTPVSGDTRHSEDADK